MHQLNILQCVASKLKEEKICMLRWRHHMVLASTPCIACLTSAKLQPEVIQAAYVLSQAALLLEQR